MWLVKWPNGIIIYICSLKLSIFFWKSTDGIEYKFITTHGKEDLQRTYSWSVWRIRRIKTNNDNGGCNFENIFTGPIINATTENKEEISEVSDSKNELAQTFCEDLTNRKRNEDKNGLNKYDESTNGIADQDDKTADRTSNTMTDIRDEIDYFDSDEEYLETCGLRFDEIDVPDE